MNPLVRQIKSTLLALPWLPGLVDSYRRRRRKSFDEVSHLFEGANGIEIGGPTRIFDRSGPFPIYEAVRGLDNLNFSASTFWSKIESGPNFRFDPSKPMGNQFISDAVDLSAIGDESYDLLISSHVIEHIANPLKALVEWRRVLRKGGRIVVVAPDKRYTYDCNRPTTTFEHIMDDLANGTTEDDSTHFEEIINLHDLSNDGTAATVEEHRKRTQQNAENRMAHHHVYDLPLLEKVLDQAGFSTLVTDTFRPYHLLIVAEKRD